MNFQVQAASSIASSVNPPNPEAVLNRLQQISEILARSEVALSEIGVKMEGPIVSGAEKLSESLTSVSAFLMDINARSQRILQNVDALNARIG